MQNSVPGRADRRPIEPPWASTILRAMKSPKPLPQRVLFARRPRAKGSKMRCRSAAGTPGPRSRTRTRALTPSVSTSIATDVPFGAKASALRTTFAIAPPSWRASARTGSDSGRAHHQIRVGELHPARGDRLVDRVHQVDLPFVERAGTGRPPQQRVHQIRQLLELVSGLLQQLAALRPRVVDTDVPQGRPRSDQRTAELVRGQGERQVQVVVPHLRPRRRAQVGERFGQERPRRPQERSMIGPHVHREQHRAPRRDRLSAVSARHPRDARGETVPPRSTRPERAHAFDRSHDVGALGADPSRRRDEPSGPGAIREEAHERHVQMREAHVDHAPHRGDGGFGPQERVGELEHRGHLADRAFALGSLAGPLNPSGHRGSARGRTRRGAARAAARGGRGWWMLHGRCPGLSHGGLPTRTASVERGARSCQTP